MFKLLFLLKFRVLNRAPACSLEQSPLDFPGGKKSFLTESPLLLKYTRLIGEFIAIQFHDI